MLMRSAATAGGILAGALVLGACGSPEVMPAAPPPPLPPAATTTSSATPPATPAPPTEQPGPSATTDTAVGGGGTPAPAPPHANECAPTGAAIPGGAATKQIIDVDGDGRPDTGWIIGNTFGITTASGATFSIPMELAGGGPRQVLVADTDRQGTIAALASDGRTADLLLVRNCGLVPATNAEGENYRFDLGFRGTGTGVGCSQVAGTSGRSLVGLNLHLDAAGQPRDIERTQIVIDGTSARNGASDTVPAAGNPAAVQTGREITCGNLTMAHDGVLQRG